MWHRANILNLFLLVICSLAAYGFVFSVKLPTATLLNSEKSEPLPLQDTLIELATDCSKDIWVSKDGQRLHYHLENPLSKIIAKSHGTSSEIVEEMSEMKLWMQDQITSTPKSTQDIRFIKSPISTFHFSSQELKTQKSFIALYSTPGEELSLYLKPEFIALQGTAETFDISLKRDGINFSALNFSAQIAEQENKTNE